MTNETLSRPNGPLIELQDVSKTYRLQGGQRFDAVHPVSLRIHRGEVFGLVGQSGAGKSTLLRLINLLERPDGGSVRVAGQDLLALGRRQLRQRAARVGHVVGTSSASGIDHLHPVAFVRQGALVSERDHRIGYPRWGIAKRRGPTSTSFVQSD